MNPSRQPRTFENYFHFFENRSKNIGKFFVWILLVAITAGIIFLGLLSTGIVSVPQSGPVPGSTPAATPVHYVEIPNH
jgi:hypothetical protein